MVDKVGENGFSLFTLDDGVIVVCVLGSSTLAFESIDGGDEYTIGFSSLSKEKDDKVVVVISFFTGSALICLLLLLV